MAYQLTCADTGASCPGSFTTETREELLEHAAMHARHSHPDMAANPDAAAMIQSLITTV